MLPVGQAQLEALLVADQQDLKTYRSGSLTLSAFRERVSRRAKIVADLLEHSGIKLLSERGKDYEAMFTLVAHSGNAALMQRYLNQHQAHSPPNVRLADRAILVDKIRLLQGVPQLFGTQFKIQNATVIFATIDQPSEVDARREQLGLGTLEQYRENILGGQEKPLYPNA